LFVNQAIIVPTLYFVCSD